jgi:hypothetical protein
MANMDKPNYLSHLPPIDKSQRPQPDWLKQEYPKNREGIRIARMTNNSKVINMSLLA